MAMEKSPKTIKSISIIGDSISTYAGYNPPNYAVYYQGQKAIDNGIENVKDTWWQQVIDSLSGKLCVNNSYSGSTVAGDADSCACSAQRCSNLHGEVQPDLILIYMGTNDKGFKIDVGIDAPDDKQKFYGAYRAMLRQLKVNYPSSKIVCATLLMAKLKQNVILPYERCMIEDERYNQAIRLAVKNESCLLADISCSGQRYESLDYCHPTKCGHQLMAQLWTEKLKIIL